MQGFHSVALVLPPCQRSSLLSVLWQRCWHLARSLNFERARDAWSIPRSFEQPTKRALCLALSPSQVGLRGTPLQPSAGPLREAPPEPRKRSFEALTTSFERFAVSSPENFCTMYVLAKGLQVTGPAMLSFLSPMVWIKWAPQGKLHVLGQRMGRDRLSAKSPKPQPAGPNAQSCFAGLRKVLALLHCAGTGNPLVDSVAEHQAETSSKP